MRLKGRYIPDNRIIEHEPAGICEDPVAPGVAELRVEPLSVMTITPRPVPQKHTARLLRKALVLLSIVTLPLAFVALADILVNNVGLFFGSFAVAFGWPAFVVWANLVKE